MTDPLLSSTVDRMRVLIDTVHPAQVLFFLPMRERLLAEGHSVRWLAREKDVSADLLHRVPHTPLTSLRLGVGGRLWEGLERMRGVCRHIREFQPDVVLTKEGAAACLAGWWMGVPTVAVDDTDDAWLQRWTSLPFATRVLTDEHYPYSYGRRHRRFRGISPLAYLSSRGLEAPAPRPRVFVRLVRWDATHDWGKEGMGDQALDALLSNLETWADVVISSERELPDRWEKLRYTGAPRDWLDALGTADALVSESPTVAAEAVVLGVPALFFSARSLWYTRLLEERGLVRTFSTATEALEGLRGWALAEEARSEWSRDQKRYLAQTEDPLRAVAQAVNEVLPSPQKKGFSSYTKEITKPVR